MDQAINVGHNSPDIGKPFIRPEKILVTLGSRLVYVRRCFTSNKGKLNTTRIKKRIEETKPGNIILQIHLLIISIRAGSSFSLLLGNARDMQISAQSQE
jgi:hypothetical protein